MSSIQRKALIVLDAILKGELERGTARVYRAKWARKASEQNYSRAYEVERVIVHSGKKIAAL